MASERAHATRLNRMIAVVWHWWFAPLLVIAAVGLTLATAGGYLAQVTKDRYPPRERRRE